MELRATAIGKHLAQHPYDRIELLAAGVRVSGQRHEYVLPFNQIIAMHCKRGLVWGELEFILTDQQAIRLHGTEWQQTQQFWQQLSALWQQWSAQMSEVAAQLLRGQLSAIEQMAQRDSWISWQQLQQLRNALQQALSALPLPACRLTEFANCRQQWQQCNDWLQQAASWRFKHNQTWTERVCQQQQAFFASVTSQPLSAAQQCAVVNNELTVLLSGGAGSGKTTCLLAHAGWLLTQKLATSEQIFMLAASPQSASQFAQQMQAYQQQHQHQQQHQNQQQLQQQLPHTGTFHSLVQQIIQHSGGKTPLISPLEQDTLARYQLLVDCWRQQCHDKKAHAKAWRNWLQQQAADTALAAADDPCFWQNELLANQLAPRLDHWLTLLRMYGSKKPLPATLAPPLQQEAEKQLTLLAPLLKAWKSALKAAGATDFFGLLQQAGSLLDSGRFISPWKYLLLDDFQHLSPAHLALLSAFRRQNPHTRLFATADDWQTIFPAACQPENLTACFRQQFGDCDHLLLETSYRLNQQLCRIASRFLLANPHQALRQLQCLRAGNKKSLMLLAEDQLARLLDKLSGYARADQRILVLARYPHLRPALLDCAATRWPTLQIAFCTIDESLGQQADYLIINGINNQPDGLPESWHCSAIDQAFAVPAPAFPHAQQRRLLYMALTRACQQVWLLYDKQQPSAFIDELKQLGAYPAKKP